MSINRYDWLRAVMQSEVSATAKTVATVFAVQFANDETGQVNPSRDTLADYLKVHRDTIKRAVRELRNAGWLMVLEGRGRGHATGYRFLSPGRIVPFATPEKGAERPAEKGANLPRKGCKSAPLHYKAGTGFEQEGRGHDPNRCPVERLAEVKSGTYRQVEWDEWLAHRRYPSVSQLGVRLNEGWGMPSTLPPSDDDEHAKRITDKFLNWACSRLAERMEASA